ncbi:hypothetical protein QYM36_005763, partial [Artemia franciscana]
MGTAKKSRSWHGNLKDTDPEVENENASVPIIDTISDSNCTSPKHSVVISESATPLSGADDEISDEESVKAQNRRKSSVLLVPEKRSRHSRRHERGNCCDSFLFFDNPLSVRRNLVFVGFLRPNDPFWGQYPRKGTNFFSQIFRPKGAYDKDALRRENKNPGFEQVKELSDKIQLAVEVPRITQRQVYRNNPPYTTPEEYYRRVVFIPMLDSVISDLKSRFSRDTLNSFRLTVLLPSNIVNFTDDLLQSSVKEISSMYGQLLGLTVPSTRATLILAEVHVWRSRWPRVKRGGRIFPSSVEKTAKKCDRHLYPYVSSLLDIFICVPVCVASAERSFSSLRKLKTWLRAQMGQTRLNGFALINILRNIDISIDR